MLRSSQMLNQLIHASHSFAETKKSMNHHHNHLQEKKIRKKKKRKPTTLLALGAMMLTNYFCSYENPTLQHQSIDVIICKLAWSNYAACL